MFSINLNDFKTQDINHDFANANVDGYKIKFHIPTNYIHIKSTADVLNPTKWSKHQGDFWKDKDTQEFMDEINSDAIKSLKLGYFSNIKLLRHQTIWLTV